jgi:NADH-quinone oxidoreductase subunit J
MALPLLMTLLMLGFVGIYLAMPGGRLNIGRAALIVLIGAAATLVGLLLQTFAAAEGRSWFIAFALIGLFGAVRVITHKRPVYSALYFVLVVVAVSGMLVLMEAQFLAAALLIIYAGAILVTYVFVIMLAQQQGSAACDRQAREPLVGCIAGFALLAVITARLFTPAAAAPDTAATAADTGTVESVGTHLLTQYVVGLEIAGVLLLAAMIGAIAIARRKAAHPQEGA